MRTSFPPSERSEAPGVHPEANEYFDLTRRRYPEAQRTAFLSIIPGLGQLANGEFSKGLLFLAIAASNVALVISCFMRDQVGSSLSSMAAALHRQPNWDLAAPVQGAVFHSPALYIYCALLAMFVGYAMRDAYDRAVERIRDGKKFNRFRLTLPEAASGSYLAHFAIMAAFAIIVVCFIAPMPPNTQVTNIELVKPEPPKAPEKPKEQPRPKPPEPKREMPKPKPVVQKVVEPPKQVVHKVEPPKPTPVAVATPTNQPTALTTAPVPVPTAAPEPAPAPVTAPTGGGGGRGTGTDSGGGGGSGEIDMGPWMRELQKKIKQNWYPPKGTESQRIKVSFKVHKDGTISHLKLVTPSGVGPADDAAEQAVESAAPFTQLPDGAGDDVDINFTFDYTVFGSGGRHSFR